MRFACPASLALSALALALSGGVAPSLAQTSESEQPVPHESGLEDLDALPALEGPISAQDLLGLPVRTYGGAPPVAVVDDLLITADGTVSKMVLNDGSFLRMDVDDKRVALPYAAATVVPDAEGLPAYLRINIAKAYGQVIKEFLYDLISPKDYAVKTILGSPLSTADAPGTARVTGMTINQQGRVTAVALDLNPGSDLAPWRVTLPMADLRLDRPGPREETRLSTPLTLDQLHVLDAGTPSGITEVHEDGSAITPPPPSPSTSPSVPSSSAPLSPQPLSAPEPASDFAPDPAWSPAPGVLLPETPPPDVPPMR